MQPTNNIDDRLAFERAIKKVKEVKSFYINLSCYCVVIPLLIGVNLYFMPQQIWWYWSAIFWGIGVAIHGISAFGDGFYGTDWEFQKVNELLEVEKGKSEQFPDNDIILGLNSNNVRYLRLHKRVQALGGFYKHLTVYIVANIALLGINHFQGEPFWSLGNWSTALFWGIGLSLHAIGIFTDNLFMGNNWEQRKIAQIMEQQADGKQYENK